MYCKLFASLYQGTLRGKADEILVFTNLLAHCGVNGTVDKHFRAISEETGLPIERVKAAIEVLESPDPESRSPEENGARIVRLDEHRVWGWRIVNYGKYRAIRSEEDRAEQNRIAQQKWRERNKSKPPSAESKQDKPKERNQGEAKEEAEATPSPKSLPAKGVTYPADFLEFWNAYPKKKSKGDACRAYQKLRGNPPNSILIAAVQCQHQNCQQWKKDGGQFIPYPATWLNDRCWEDELPIAQAPQKEAADDTLEMQARMAEKHHWNHNK